MQEHGMTVVIGPNALGKTLLAVATLMAVDMMAPMLARNFTSIFEAVLSGRRELSVSDAVKGLAKIHSGYWFTASPGAEVALEVLGRSGVERVCPLKLLVQQLL